MRNLIVFGVFLLLAITDGYRKGYKPETPYKFGDLLSFPRCKCGFTYSHYAVYLGRTLIDGTIKTVNEDIFHRTDTSGTRKTHCKFGKLSEQGKPTLMNYLDHETDLKAKVNNGAIEGRIREKLAECGAYGVKSNNCEHLATYVRYGVSVALQLGTKAQGKCRNENNKYNIEEILEKKKAAPDYEENWSTCGKCKPDNRRHTV